MEIFESLKNLENFKSTVYKSQHERSIQDIDVCAMLGLTDSDLARCIDTRRSYTEFLYLLGSCPVSWHVSNIINNGSWKYVCLCVYSRGLVADSQHQLQYLKIIKPVYFIRRIQETINAQNILIRSITLDLSKSTQEMLS